MAPECEAVFIHQKPSTKEKEFQFVSSYANLINV